MGKFVSRAGEKLQFGLDYFKISVKDKICADFGASTGGFVDCLLQNGAEKVYAVEVGYGVLEWKLRKDPRVVVLERTNAMHVTLPQKANFISIDVGWTKQSLIIPNAIANLKDDGIIVSLIKPQYETLPKYVKKGKVLEDKMEEVLEKVKKDITETGAKLVNFVESPLVGEKGKNREFLALIALVESSLR